MTALEYEIETAGDFAMDQLYARAKAARVGSMIACPTCGKEHLKTTYHKVFCSNGKTKRGGNCKDRYWNTVDEERSERAGWFR